MHQQTKFDTSYHCKTMQVVTPPHPKPPKFALLEQLCVPLVAWVRGSPEVADLAAVRPLVRVHDPVMFHQRLLLHRAVGTLGTFELLVGGVLSSLVNLRNAEDSLQ